MKGTFKVESKISEKDLIEHCLNLHHSGYDCNIILFFHALAKRWHYDKFVYYINLIKEKSTKQGDGE